MTRDMIVDPHTLFESWERQQTAFIEFREARTACMMNSIAHLHGSDSPLRILDLGCGPGSLSRVALDRFPQCTVVGLDRDPVLLRLFADTLSEDDRARVTIIDTDLRDPRWVQTVPAGGYTAAVSATALHWLEPGELWGIYRGLAELLEPGGSVMNADHLLFDATTHSRFDALSTRDRDQEYARAIESGAMEWEEWWKHALAVPGWESEAQLHRERWSDTSSPTKASLELHMSMMNAAGFTETGVLWRYLDDVIVCGLRPTDPNN